MKHIPRNAHYRSPAIQNEVIHIMKDVVIEETICDITSADIPYYTIKSDGTRDRTNTENVSVAVRYVKNGKVHEELIGMLQTDKCDAESISSQRTYCRSVTMVLA